MTYRCPFCDHEVKVGSPCPGCAAKVKRKKTAAAKSSTRPAKKSWQQDSVHDGLDLPDENFDYDEFIAREFGTKPHKKIGVKWYWWLIGVGLLAMMIAGILHGRDLF